jgi:hypothetical protein
MLVGMPERAIRVDEPGVNTAKCPHHNQWLYRRSNKDREASVDWCCGVAGCDYSNNTSAKSAGVQG